MRAGDASSANIAQALVAGLLQGLGERDNDQNQVDAGKRLAAEVGKQSKGKGHATSKRIHAGKDHDNYCTHARARRDRP
jgi:hypothetical protein